MSCCPTEEVLLLEQRMLVPVQEMLTCSPGCALTFRSGVLPKQSSDHSEIISRAGDAHTGVVLSP